MLHLTIFRFHSPREDARCAKFEFNSKTQILSLYNYEGEIIQTINDVWHFFVDTD